LFQLIYHSHKDYENVIGSISTLLKALAVSTPGIERTLFFILEGSSNIGADMGMDHRRKEFGKIKVK